MQKDLCSVWFGFIPSGATSSKQGLGSGFGIKAGNIFHEFLDHCVAVGPLSRDYLNVSLVKI